MLGRNVQLQLRWVIIFRAMSVIQIDLLLEGFAHAHNEPRPQAIADRLLVYIQSDVYIVSEDPLIFKSALWIRPGTLQIRTCPALLNPLLNDKRESRRVDDGP